MHVSQALDIINSYKPNQVETLADLLPIELINSAYELTDTVTLRKRKLTLESMASGKPFVAPSALTQRRKNLGESAAKALFECTQSH